MLSIQLTREPHAGRFRVKMWSPDEDAFNSALWLLKNSWPAFRRAWSPATKEWTVSESSGEAIDRWLDRLRELFVTMVDNVTIREPRQRRQSTGRGQPKRVINENYAVLHLQPTAPPELVMAARKCLALRYHPDRGGDLEQMKQINSAADEILRRLSAA